MKTRILTILITTLVTAANVIADDLPKAVMNALTNKFPAAKIDK